MGDTVLTTPLMNTIKQNFPNSQVDIILNEKIAPLLYNHPNVDNIITFTEDERHNLPIYLMKVWRIMRKTHYDVIIDMRSNINTLVFSLMSLGSKIRSGVEHGYSRPILNHVIQHCQKREQMVDHNLKILSPLESLRPMVYDRTKTLVVTDEEKQNFKIYMQKCGLDFSRPIMLAGVTAKLLSKTWNKDYIKEVLNKFVAEYSDVQIVLNYAPGREAEDAKEIFESLKASNIFINVEAKGLRALMAMAANTDFYFGNEGGTRHIAEALGKPTFSICSPGASKYTWIPVNDKYNFAIEPSDFADEELLSTMTHEQKYDLINPDYVWKKLKEFMRLILSDYKAKKV